MKVSSDQLEIAAKLIKTKQSLDLLKLFKINVSEDKQLTSDDIEDDKKKHKEIINKVLKKKSNTEKTSDLAFKSPRRFVKTTLDFYSYIQDMANDLEKGDLKNLKDFNNSLKKNITIKGGLEKTKFGNQVLNMINRLPKLIKSVQGVLDEYDKMFDMLYDITRDPEFEDIQLQ